MTRLAFLISVALISSSAAAAENRPLPGDLTGHWQLFVDDYLVAAKKGVVRRYHPFEKYSGNPLIVADKPWEKDCVNSCTVLPEEDGSGFRMYYYCWTEDPKTKKSHASLMCYATSKDGLKWEKPNLGLYQWEGDGTTNNNVLPPRPRGSHVHALGERPQQAISGRRRHVSRILLAGRPPLEAGIQGEDRLRRRHEPLLLGSAHEALPGHGEGGRQRPRQRRCARPFTPRGGFQRDLRPDSFSASPHDHRPG